MCGLAGRMAMELGLHNQEMSQHCLENDEQRTAVVNLSCSILVLDRQWSAAAGLPNNFQESDFDAAIVSAVSSGYLVVFVCGLLLTSSNPGPSSIRKVDDGLYVDEQQIQRANFQSGERRSLHGRRFLRSHQLFDRTMEKEVLRESQLCRSINVGDHAFD